jgi:ribosomal protein S18 acetylase RimI-like enzyme
MTETMVREARETDIPAIEELIGELLDAVENAGGLDREAAVENCRALIRDPQSHVLVAQVGSELAGFINFTTRKTILHSKTSGLIDELVVARDYRGEGLGGILIEAAIAKCREIGCGEVEVSTERSNLKAREFYKKLGFDEEAFLLELDLG